MPDDQAQPTTTIERMKRPASQYYWGDWWKDKGLQSCSQPARGLWHEMNTLMHEGEPYGHLTVNNKPMTVAQLANLCRITPGKCKVLVDELLAAGVPSTDPATGALFSRRMVRDERIREARANGGKEGAEHGVKGAEHGKKGGRPTKKEGGEKTPLTPSKNPPPSSSSSASPSRNTSPPSGAPANTDKPDGPVLTGVEQRSPTPLKTCPKTFIVTEAMVLWASTEFPILTLEELKKETRAFRNHRYKTGRIEWVPTWENWVKEAADRKTRSARPAGAGTAYRNERDARVAKGAPGLAAPAVRKPGEPLTFVEDVTNDQPRQPRIAQG